MQISQRLIDCMKSPRAIVAVFALAIHLTANVLGGYGLFRDELYYLACASHPAAGYVDQPPLSILILATVRFFLGDSLFAIRLLPALAGAATIYLTGTLALRMGGGRLAEALASIATFASVVLRGISANYSMNSLDVLIWTLAALALVRLIQQRDPRLWLVLGVVLGLGLLNKISVAWLGAGIGVGVLLTGHRIWYTTRWPWYSFGIAVVLFLPFVVWNAFHEWAHIEFMRNATGMKYSGITVGAFVREQFIIHNPLTIPVWLSGIFFYFFTKPGREFRPLGIVFVTAFVILAVNGHSKGEYLAPAFPILFAGGGVMLEHWVTQRHWITWSYASTMLISGLLLLPFGVPILPVETFINYSSALGVIPSNPESKQLGRLPQYYADMFGWKDKAVAVAQAFNSLTADEKPRCAIFGDNYGRCAAIEYYGKALGLPISIGAHNSYWIWGPRGYDGSVVIVLGGDLEDKLQIYDSVSVAGTVRSEYCMPYENNLRVYICRGLHQPLGQVWPLIKIYQ